MVSSDPRSTTSHVLFLLLLAAFATGATAAPLTITNHCSYTVWPAVVPVDRGIELRPSANWTVDVPSGSDIWGRMGCSFDKGGRGSCQTGDCGGLVCASGSSSSNPVC
ncbi:hypothetical protein QYE76_001255 [Lolium multiflorum]|uniref:Thaumatin-like protein n=1 Tax=Lolium multiflorum TaxID=4521 RepID=A0AAD8VWS5_LOLMU|nr:hypothetical protein QYE76_001255 [Lolium multiflorum]